MFPVLIKTDLITIQAYGFFFALAYLVAYLSLRKSARIANYPPGLFSDLALLCILTGVIGGRIFFVVQNWSAFTERWWEALYFWSGGLVFYGGFLTATFALIFYFRWRKIPVLRGLDLCVPALALSHAVGRIGCFFAGCCHGKLCDLPWSVRLNSTLVSPELRGLPIHPTQLYESVALLVIGIFAFKILQRNKPAGTASYFYLMAYPATRFVVEIFRGDSIRGEISMLGISTSQGISIFLFLLGSTLFIRSLRSNY